METRGRGSCVYREETTKVPHFLLIFAFSSLHPLVGTAYSLTSSRQVPSLPNMRFALLQMISAIGFLLGVINALPVTPSSGLEARQSFNPTRNDLSGPCKPVTILFARGTVELGNVGLLAGPPFFNALGAMIGFDNIAVQGVDYLADIPGYLLGGSSSGTNTLVGLLSTATSKCPNTQLVVGGYRSVFLSPAFSRRMAPASCF
jgi:hypothetical protein